MPYIPKAKRQSAEPPAVVFPVYGCQPMRGMSREEMEKQQRTRAAELKKHWESDGVKAVVELIEIQGAICQRRACAREATSHDAGQAFALAELLGQLQRLRFG